MKKFLLLCAVATVVFANENLLIGAGGGYKKPVSAVVENLKKDGVNIDAAYANIGQIAIQAKEGSMALIVGDEAFLKNKSGLKISGFERLGKGELVLVTPKGKSINDVSELKNFSKIAIANPQKAIYGIRAVEFIKNAKLEIEDKILAVAGVPQVLTYVLNGEVDAGFINSTEVVANEGKFGSVIYLNQNLYSPVFISAAKLKACDKNSLCEKFIDELKTQRSKEIFAKFGLK